MKLLINQIVLEKFSFEHRGAFMEKEPTSIAGLHNADLSVEVLQGVPADKYGVRLKATCTDPNSQYLFDVSYIVLFSVDGPVGDDFTARIGVTGANMAMPFIREIVGSVTARGRFGPVWLNPVDFSTMVPGPKVKPARRRRRQRG